MIEKILNLSILILDFKVVRLNHNHFKLLIAFLNFKLVILLLINKTH